MIKPCTTKLPAVLSPAALSFAFLVSFGFFNDAKALCNTNSCLNGYVACLSWCENHNKTNKSKGVCSAKCGDYWHDGASIGRSSQPNPPGPPRKVVGPGKLKNPPTKVSNPNTPTPPPEQIRTRQKR
jgi:hypothetical protein